MSRSLRARLTRSLVAVLVVSLALLSLVVHVVIARALERQLDGRLLDDADAVAGMAEDDAGATEFEYESLPDFERADRPAYFEAWLDDATVLARSPSLGRGELPRLQGPPAGPVFAARRLPDGRAGRIVYLRRPLRLEAPGAPAEGRASPRFVTVAVVRGTEELAETLAAVRRWLLLLAGLTLVGASAAAVAAVARGLRSTRHLGAEIAALDAVRPGRVSAPSDLPTELAPLVDKLNELLGRVEESFAREKRFTADVSHELRTPLAALRATLDVFGSRSRSAAELQQMLSDVNALVRQMQALCENLLALARLDAGRVPLRMTEVNVRALVDECWAPLADAARARSLRFENELEPGAVAVTDPDQLRVVVANLLSNAASYTAAGGAIRVSRPKDGRGGLLEVHDSGPGIPEEAMPHIFERFFRADPARSDGVHCGIGLALVQGIADVLRLTVSAENTADGGISFSLRRHE
jgi:two-component system sensor histidine kinase QseC